LADTNPPPRAVRWPASGQLRVLDRADQAAADQQVTAPAADLAAPRLTPGAPDVPERYLAPALNAAAAARARSAQIRAATVETLAPRTAGDRPAGQASTPAAPALPAVRRTGGWSISEKPPVPAGSPAAAPGRTPALSGPSGGLSVAAAARAATIAFQPLRRPAPAATAGSDASIPAGPATTLARTPAPGPPPGPAQPATAGLSTAFPIAPDRLPASGWPAAVGPSAPVAGPRKRMQRFARTVAELERHGAATGEQEPGSNVVPRPTLPLADPEPGGWSWLRPWWRR
jgi:DNA polymerase-3 subunit gamma/tau